MGLKQITFTFITREQYLKKLIIRLELENNVSKPYWKVITGVMHVLMARNSSLM